MRAKATPVDGVRVRVLGPIAVEHDGRELHVAGAQRRRLLAFLASRAASPASVDAIADVLWGDALPLTATKAIQNHVARLRRSFESLDGELVETTAAGYRLAVAPEAIDAVAFEQLAGAGRRRLETGDAAGAATALEEALGLWRGPAYGDIADALFAASEAARLDELRWAVGEDLAAARLETGNFELAIADLERLVREQPARERGWALLVRALYAAGRQRDALAAYQRVRTALAEQFGLEPGPELRELERRVLDQDPELAIRRTARLPATLRRHGRPLMGREAERVWLVDAWRAACRGFGQVRLLLGPVESGRTRLLAEIGSVAIADGAQVMYLRGGDELGSSPGAFVDRITDRSRTTPVLVAVDDAEWASASTSAALSALAAAITQAPVLLAVVADPTGGAALQVLRRVISGSGESLTIEPMPDRDIAALVAADGIGEDGVGAVVAVAGGLPGVARREAAAWAEREASARLLTNSASSVGASVVAADARASVFDDVLHLVAARARRDELTSHEWSGRQPYRSLAWYDAQDADLFVGRERLVAELAARVLERRLVAVVGASGCGKSSLVRAGLVPLVRSGRLPGADPWRAAVVVPGTDPIAALDAVDGLDEPGHLLLVVDQFEEVFTAGAAETVAARLIELSSDAALDVHVVVVLRSDQYPALASVRRLAALVEESQVLVGAPTDEELHRIVEVPARRTGCEVDPALTARVVDDVAGRDAALPLVSAALAEVWERRDGEVLTLDRYLELGGLAVAVQRMGTRAVEQAGADEIRAVMLRLVDVTDDGQWVRRRLPAADLLVELEPAVAALADERLVQRDELWVDVVHEVVFSAWPLLAGWLDEMRADLVLDRELRGAASAWDSAGQDTDYLYRGARLIAATELQARRENADPLVERFVAASTETAERAADERARQQSRVNRRLRVLLGGAGVLLVVALAAGLLAMRQAERADDSAAAARAEALRADARAVGDRARTTVQTDLALLLAVAGVRLHDSPETRESLLSVLAANRGVIAPSRRELPGLVAADPAGGRLVGYRDGRLSIHDPVTLDGMAQSAPVPHVRDPLHVEFNPDGIELAVIHEGYDFTDSDPTGTFADAPLVLYDSRTLRPMARQPGGIPPLAAGQDIAYSADGRFVAASFAVYGTPGDAVPSSSPIFVWDRSAPDIPIATIDTGAPRNRLALSPDGTRLYVAAAPTQHAHAFDVASGDMVATAANVGGRVSISADGTMLAATGGVNDGGVTILDPATMTELTRLEARVNTSLSIPSFSHDGSRVAAAAWDETVVYEWDIETGDVTEVLVGQSAFLEGVWFDPDDGTVHAAGDDDSLIGWDLVDGRRFVRRTPPPAGQRPADLPLLLDHQRVVYVGGVFGASEEGGTLQVRDLAAGRLAERFDVGHDVVFAAAWRPDGERIATTGVDGVVRVWEAATGDLLLEQQVGGFVGALFYDRDGDRIVVGEEAGPVYTLDAETLEPAGALFDTGESLFTVTPGPADGTAILIPSDPSDTTVSIVDVRGARLLHELDAGFVAFNAAVSPDGGRVAFGGAHGELRIFELGRMEWLGPPVVATGADIQSSIVWSADGRTIVTGSQGGAVALWDAQSGATVGTFAPSPDAGAVAVTFVGSGSTVLVLAADGSTYTWDSDPTSWIDLACDVAGRELTAAEWQEALGERPYEETCPQT